LAIFWHYKVAPFMVSSWEVEVVLVGWLVHQAGARFFFIRLGLILPYVGGNGGIVRSEEQQRFAIGLGEGLAIGWWGVAEAWYKFALL
jgi:hypothetical protein